jgi:ectoine hydroxylase-related dioxygenase (phytanoyl-CoA dioxygenase family)
VFEEAVLNPKLVAVMTYMLGRAYMVSTLTAMVRPQGTTALPLHSDNQFMPQPFPPYAQVATAIWCCEDFSAERGAIRFVPGSHKYLRHPTAGEGESRWVAAECPKGSVIVWNGNTWHGNCARTVPGERVTLHTAFSRPHLRPMESYIASFPQHIIDRNGPLFAQLIGLDLPYGFDATGPDAMKMARLAFTTMSLT